MKYKLIIKLIIIIICKTLQNEIYIKNIHYTGYVIESIIILIRRHKTVAASKKNSNEMKISLIHLISNKFI